MPLTQAGASASLRESSNEVWLTLVEITHPTIPASGLKYPSPTSDTTLDTTGNTLRLVFNTEPVVSGGRTFVPAVVEATWLEQAADRPPRSMLKIGFATSLIKELREIVTPPDLLVTLKCIIASAPNDIQGQVVDGVVRAIEYDSLNIEAELLRNAADEAKAT